MSYEKRKTQNLLLELFVIFTAVLVLMLLLYFVMKLSFQEGERSISASTYIADRIAHRIYTEPTEDEVRMIGRVLRYGAHLGLFFVVGLVTTFVSMVIFRRYYRIFGVLLSGGLCYILAYYTEYYKQFVEGRHFQQSDVVLNWYGSAAGIACMVVSYFMNRILVKLSS